MSEKLDPIWIMAKLALQLSAGARVVRLGAARGVAHAVVMGRKHDLWDL